MANFDYNCGVMDAFCEIVKAEVKDLALSHPMKDFKDALQYEPFVVELCERYQVSYYLEEALLKSELFKNEDQENMMVYLFFKKKEVLETYLNLKLQREELLKNNSYHAETRKTIAAEFGRLLSYSEAMIKNFINEEEVT